MSTRLRIAAILLLTAGMLTQFTNCADSLPDNMYATNLTSQSTPDPNKLLLTAVPQTIAPGQTSQVSVVGGIAPYVYTATAGTASVSTTGLVSGLGVGAATIEVTDQNGNHSSISITVAAPGSAGMASCTTAYGQTVPHAGQVNIYASAVVACPAVCTAQTVTCNNGTLVGAPAGHSGTCRVDACVYKITTSNACPNIGVVPPFYTPPATCAAADFGKYFCGAPQGTKQINEYRCSSP